MLRNRCALVALAVLSMLLLDVGCRRRQRRTELPLPTRTTITPRPPLEGWPRVLVATGGDAPALFAGWETDAPAIGFLRRGVRVRVESAPIRDRVLVTVAGSLAARGWAPLSKLGAYVRRAGRLESSPAYLTPNDLVSLVGPRVIAGSIRVAARPPLSDGQTLGPYLGAIPLASLSDRPGVGEPSGLTEGACQRLPEGAVVEVHLRPGGDAIETLPALDPPLQVTVLTELGAWRGIRVGEGPYLTGYVQAELTACDPDAAAPPAPPRISIESEVPSRVAEQPGPMFRVAAGTRITSRGQTIGRLMTEGWARGLAAPSSGWADVFVSTSDGAALRGLVPTSALSEAFDPSSVDVASLGRQLDASVEPVRACFSSLSASSPARAGRVVVRLRLEPNGSASGAVVSEAAAEETAFWTCMASAVSALRFDPAPAGSVTLLYPLELAPESPTP